MGSDYSITGTKLDPGLENRASSYDTRSKQLRNKQRMERSGVSVFLIWPCTSFLDFPLTQGPL